MGLHVAGAFERYGERPFSPSRKGALVGAVDGFLFLAVVGVLLGAIAGHYRFKGPVTTSLVMAVLLLFAGALFFGGLAYAASSAGLRGVAALFFGAVAGGVPGFWLASATGLLIGVIGGAALGTVGLLLQRRFAPSPPRSLPDVQDTNDPANPDEFQEKRPEEW